MPWRAFPSRRTPGPLDQSSSARAPSTRPGRRIGRSVKGLRHAKYRCPTVGCILALSPCRPYDASASRLLAAAHPGFARKVDTQINRSAPSATSGQLVGQATADF